MNDILEALDWIAAAIGDRTEAEFLGDETLCYAVAQRLTVIGEAAARLTKVLKRKHRDVPWADITAFRNIVVHEYFGLDWAIVYRTATDRVSELRAQIAAILER